MALVLSMQVLSSIASASAPLAPAVPALVPHGPIVINGDGNFTYANGVRGGSGSAADPYLITGWSISVSDGPAVMVRNTTAAFTVMSITVQVANKSSVGIRFANVADARVENITVARPWLGVDVEQSRNVTVASSNVTALFLAVRFKNSTASLARGNEVDAGIGVEGSSDARVLGNRILEYASDGVVVIESQRVNVSFNDVRGVMNRGVKISGSSDVDVYQNGLFESYFGIESWSSTRLRLVGNNMWGSHIGIHLVETTHVAMQRNQLALYDGLLLEGSTLDAFDSHTIGEDNLINGYPILYRKDCPPGTALDFFGHPVAEAIVVNCPNVRVSNLSLHDTQVSLLMAYVDGGEVTGNKFYRIWQGGVILTQSSGVVVHRNLFFDTGGQDDGTSNRWNAPYPLGGNWWSRYQGRDECGSPDQDECPNPDGMGDFPYQVGWREPALDRYPIMWPMNWTGSPPVASLSNKSGVAVAGAAVTLNASASYDPDGGSLQVRWDWEADGGWDTWWSSSLFTQHTYDSPGTYSVRIVVRDRDGFWTVASQKVVVSAASAPPILQYFVPVIALVAAIIVAVIWRGRRRRRVLPSEEPPNRPT